MNAWVALGGSRSPNYLVVDLSFEGGRLRVDSMCCKSCYTLLLHSRYVTRHCVVKFFPSFGLWEWETPWKSLFFFPFDRHVIDFNWKVSHRVLYTAERLSPSVVMSPQPVFVVITVSLLNIYFFPAL